MNIPYEIEEFEFDGETLAVELSVEFTLGRYYAAIGPSWNDPGSPAEGGQIEELEVSLVEARRLDGAVLIGMLHDLVEKQVKKQIVDGGPLLEAIESKIYEQPIEDDWEPDWEAV